MYYVRALFHILPKARKTLGTALISTMYSFLNILESMNYKNKSCYWQQDKVVSPDTRQPFTENNPTFFTSEKPVKKNVVSFQSNAPLSNWPPSR